MRRLTDAERATFNKLSREEGIEAAADFLVKISEQTCDNCAHLENDSQCRVIHEGTVTSLFNLNGCSAWEIKNRKS